MRAALTVAAKDLRQRLRDRSALVIAFVAPLVLSFIIGGALGQAQGNFQTTIAVADADGGPLARTFITDVLGSEQLRRAVTTKPVRDAAEARSVTDDGSARAAFVFPPGYSADVLAGRRTRLQVLTRSDDSISAAVAHGIADDFAARVNAVALAVATAGALGRPPPNIAALARTDLPASVTMTSATSGDPNPASYFAPAMAMFFLFFTVGLGARSLFAERRNATLSRLLAAPIPARTILVGKALAALVLGLASMLVVLGASAALLGAGWGDPVAVVALVVSIVLFATAVTWLLASLAKTEEQANAYASVVAMVLSLLGGNFFPIDQAPAGFRQVALLTPNGQALRAFADLDSLGGGLSTALPHVWVILAVTAVIGAAAFARSSRLVAA